MSKVTISFEVEKTEASSLRSFLARLLLANTSARAAA
jgi:hypothetical protein